MSKIEEKKYKYGLELNNEVDCVFAIANALTLFITHGFYDKEAQYIMAALKDFIGNTSDYLEFISWFGDFNEYSSTNELKQIRSKWYKYADSEEMLAMQRG